MPFPKKKEWNQIEGRDGKIKTDGFNKCLDLCTKAVDVDEIDKIMWKYMSIRNPRKCAKAIHSAIIGGEDD